MIDDRDSMAAWGEDGVGDNAPGGGSPLRHDVQPGPESAGADWHDDQQWPADSDAERRAVFARLFAENDRWLFAYLVTLLGNPDDAQEVFQEVCVVIWKNYKRFNLGTSFVSWAAAIAVNQVRRFRRSQRRRPMILSDEAVELIAAEAVESADLLDARRSALHGCLERLRDRDRELVKQCYRGGATLRQVAEQIGRPENTVYKAMGRIRRSLHECICRKLSREGLQ